MEYANGTEVIVKYDPVKKNASYYLGLKGKLSKDEYYGIVGSHELDHTHKIDVYNVFIPALKQKGAVPIKPKNIELCTWDSCKVLQSIAMNKNPEFFKHHKSTLKKPNTNGRTNNGFRNMTCTTARDALNAARNHGGPENIAAAEERITMACRSGGSRRSTRRKRVTRRR